MTRTTFSTVVSCLAAGLMAASPASATPPKVGESASEFHLKTLSGESVRLTKGGEKGPVVLVVLRGWPGYQCPICTRQVGELIGKSKQLAEANARVILVYPGPAGRLADHAEEFVRGRTLPENFSFVVDPDYAFTKNYDLRWDAPGETAYPSTFVINRQGRVVFAKTSRSHGGRPSTDEVLKALGQE